MENSCISTLALEIALREAGLERGETADIRSEKQGELYYVSFRSLFLQWEFYIDANLCVRGLNTEPFSESPLSYPAAARFCAA